MPGRGAGMRVRCTGLVVALVACGGRDDVPAHPDDTEHTDVVDTVPGDSGVVDDSALDPVDSGGPGLPDSGPSAPYDTSPRFDSDDTDCVVGETAVDSGLAATWDGRVARASAFDAVNHACVHTAWRCTDTSGRALRLAVWARDPHVTRYYDAATGDLVATHLERPHACFGRGDAWIGEKIVGCVPVDEELVGCDTDALCPEPSGAACDSATDCWSPPLIPPVDDGEPCATWPAGDGTLARAAASPLLDVTLAGNVPQVRGVGDVTGDGVDDVLLSNPAYYGPTEPP